MIDLVISELNLKTQIKKKILNLNFQVVLIDTDLSLFQLNISVILAEHYKSHQEWQNIKGGKS